MKSVQCRFKFFWRWTHLNAFVKNITKEYCEFGLDWRISFCEGSVHIAESRDLKFLFILYSLKICPISQSLQIKTQEKQTDPNPIELAIQSIPSRSYTQSIADPQLIIVERNCPFFVDISKARLWSEVKTIQPTMCMRWE